MPGLTKIDKYTPIECIDFAKYVIIALRTTAFSSSAVRFYSLSEKYGLNSPTDEDLYKEQASINKIFNEILPTIMQNQ